MKCACVRDYAYVHMCVCIFRYEEWGVFFLHHLCIWSKWAVSERVSCRVLVIQCSNLKRKTLSQTSNFLLDFEVVTVLLFLVLLIVVGAGASPLAFRSAETALFVVPRHRMQAPDWPLPIFLLWFFEKPDRLIIFLHARQAAASSGAALAVVASLLSARVCMRMTMRMGMGIRMIEGDWR